MRRRSRRSLVLLAPLAALALLASCAEDEGDSNTGSATTTTAGNEKQGAFEARFEAERCDDDAPEVARCGIVAVPLDHAEPEGETIELAVAVLPSRREDTDAAPLLLLGGGPGEDLVEPLLESLDDGTSSIGALTQRRDVVLFDQRGAGESEPSLDCPDTEATLARADTSRPTSVADAGVEAAEECHEELVEDDGIDLSAFNTLQNVEDVDLVRQALDYEEIDVFGTSYGALLGLQYARDHSDVLRSLVLSSAIPPDATYIADAGTSLQRALDAVADACAADAACDRDNPDLPGTLDRLTARLAEEPEELPVGEERTVPFAPADAAAVIAGLFYLPGGVAALPSVITAIEAGDLSVLEDLALSIRAPVSMVSEGMNFSFNCSEQAPQSSAREVERRAHARRHRGVRPDHPAGLRRGGGGVARPGHAARGPGSGPQPAAQPRRLRHRHPGGVPARTGPAPRRRLRPEADHLRAAALGGVDRTAMGSERRLRASR